MARYLACVQPVDAEGDLASFCEPPSAAFVAGLLMALAAFANGLEAAEVYPWMPREVDTAGLTEDGFVGGQIVPEIILQEQPLQRRTRHLQDCHGHRAHAGESV